MRQSELNNLVYCNGVGVVGGTGIEPVTLGV